MVANIVPDMNIATAQERPEPPITVVASHPKPASIKVPYNDVAEQSVLAGILINPDAYHQAAEFLKETDFYLLRHQYIFAAMNTIAARKEPIDYITLSTELKSKNKLDEIGGSAYLNQMSSRLDTSLHTAVYAQLVQRAATRRRLMVVSDQIKALAIDESKELSSVISECEKNLIDAVDVYTGTRTRNMQQATGDYYEKVERLMQNKTRTGLLTGFKDLDHMLAGIDKDALTIIAGRPGMGKTSMLLSLSLNMAKKGARVAVFSMEMLLDQLMRRLISMEAHINSQTLKNGTLNPEEWARFVKTSGEISKLPIFLDDTAVWTPLQLRAKMTTMKRRMGIDVFVVDHAGLMNGGGRYKDNKAAEQGYVSRSLKEIVMDLNTPILAAVQLNRKCEERQDKRPVKSDLRDSGTWEQDADNILFLYRDEVYNEATEFPNQADVIVDKQRNGPTGTISLYFEKAFTKFLNAADRSIDLSHI